MSEVTDKKNTFTDVQEVYYNDIARYVSDVNYRLKTLKDEDVPLVLEVIYLEWVERLEESND